MLWGRSGRERGASHQSQLLFDVQYLSTNWDSAGCKRHATAAIEGVLQLVPGHWNKTAKEMIAGDIRACTQVQATKSRPEVEQALHGQRRDAGCDDGEGKICAVGNEHVVRPAVNESSGMKNK
jgi:hypothetical protein